MKAVCRTSNRAEKHIKNILNNVMFCSMPRCAHHLI